MLLKNGELLDLTAAEYRLLCLFMQNPNVVLSREQILANREIRHLFLLISLIMAFFLLLAELCFLFLYQRFSPWIALLTLAAAVALWISCCWYFIRQDRIMEHAVSQIDSFLSGNAHARIECDEEGEL